MLGGLLWILEAALRTTLTTVFLCKQKASSFEWGPKQAEALQAPRLWGKALYLQPHLVMLSVQDRAQC